MAFNKKERADCIYKAEQISKGALVKVFVDTADQLNTWIEVAMNISAYLYMVMPFADIFTNKTFAPKTLEQIKERVKANYKDSCFNQVIWIVNETRESNPEGPRIDIISLSNAEQFTELLKILNDVREKIINQEDIRNPADCANCLFKESCSDSTTRTGFRVYSCEIFQPIPISDSTVVNHYRKEKDNEHTDTKDTEGKGRSDPKSSK